jgi:hypothetical protein
LQTPRKSNSTLRTHKPITDPDTEDCSPKFWSDVLNSHNLSMKRGAAEKTVAYYGDLNSLVVLENHNREIECGNKNALGSGTRKGRKHGHGPQT